jgi:hypothetical protein
MVESDTSQPDIETAASAEGIAKNLWLLKETATPLMVILETQERIAGQAVLKVDLIGRKLLLGHFDLSFPDKTTCRVEGRYGERAFWFDLDHTRILNEGGSHALIARFPGVFKILQRRRAVRVQLPEEAMTRVNISTERGWQLVGSIEDLSTGGLRMNCLGDKRLLVRQGNRVGDARLIFAEHFALTAELEVLEAVFDPVDNLTSVRMRFVDLGETGRRQLLLAVDSLQAGRNKV